MSPARKRPEKTKPTPPEGDVKQDPSHNEADFFRDLEKATTNQAKKRLAAARAGRG
jgi:hypothetical protein